MKLRTSSMKRKSDTYSQKVQRENFEIRKQLKRWNSTISSISPNYS